MLSLPLRYSKGDTEKLKIYHALHGNDWKKIGELVARSSLSVALKFSQIGSGKLWSPLPTRCVNKPNRPPAPGSRCRRPVS